MQKTVNALFVAAAVLCGWSCGSTAALAQSDPVEKFYKGKTITLLVGSAAGGGYDAYARLLAPHLSRHIPGAPAVVVQNMPGAGGLIQANHFSNVAARDGTVLALLARTVLLAHLLTPGQVHFDAAKFNWLGSMASEPGILVAWHTAPVTKVDDLFRHELIVGGAGINDDSETTPKILNAVLGTKFRVVSGYQGLASATLAMEKGEVQGVADWTWSNAKQLKPQYLRDHLVNVIMQFDVARNVDLPEVPTPLDLAKTDEDRQLLRLYFTPKQVARPVALTPDAPIDRANAIRKAFQATMADEDFLAEAGRSKIIINYTPASTIEKAMATIKSAPKSVTDRLVQIFAQ